MKKSVESLATILIKSLNLKVKCDSFLRILQNKYVENYVKTTVTTTTIIGIPNLMNVSQGQWKSYLFIIFGRRVG